MLVNKCKAAEVRAGPATLTPTKQQHELIELLIEGRKCLQATLGTFITRGNFAFDAVMVLKEYIEMHISDNFFYA